MHDSEDLDKIFLSLGEENKVEKMCRDAATDSQLALRPPSLPTSNGSPSRRSLSRIH